MPSKCAYHKTPLLGCVQKTIDHSFDVTMIHQLVVSQNDLSASIQVMSPDKSTNKITDSFVVRQLMYINVERHECFASQYIANVLRLHT